MTPERIARLKQYFSYAHLPPHLRAASEPYGEIAARMLDGETSGNYLIELLLDEADQLRCRVEGGVEMPDIDELALASDACESAASCLRVGDREAAIVWLLRAKDHAVRAVL